MKDNLVTGQSFIICKEEGEFKTMMNKNIHLRAVVYRPHFQVGTREHNYLFVMACTLYY